MTKTFFDKWTIERGLESYEIEFEYGVVSWGCSAQTYGPPENCWPEEGPEIELGKAWTDAPPWAVGKYPHGAMGFALTDAERWKIEEWIAENLPEADYPEYEYDDR